MDSLDRRMVLGVAGLAGAAALSKLAHAGTLTPPSGAVGPTPGPEPRTPIGPGTTPGDATCVYKITQSGSYYLTGNVQGVANKHGILVTASDVNIDLCGFSVIGTGKAQTNGSGVITTGARLSVYRGNVRGWQVAGINDAALASDIAASDSTHGVLAYGRAIIDRCSASGCDIGIAAAAGRVCGCVVSDCSTGIYVTKAHVDSCEINSCTSTGIDAAGASLIERCTIVGSGASNGVWARPGANGCTIEGCMIRETGNGVLLNAITTVRRCSLEWCGTGIRAANTGSCTLIDNVCKDNTSYGIDLSASGCRVEGNTLSGNGQFNLIARDAFTLIVRNVSSRPGNGALTIGFTGTSGHYAILDGWETFYSGPWKTPGLSTNPWLNMVH